ncbi:MAG: tRNA (cytidine(34)-2'-O)-methyltransferase [Lentisphaerota bacterium]
MNKFEIVLFSPQIPQNTGNIGRLCVNTNSKLHLIKPLGFSLDEKYIKRAGMDYWQYVDLQVHENWSTFAESKDRNSLFFFSTKTDKAFWNCSYSADTQDEKVYLVFGSESKGLSAELYKNYADRLYTIPMFGEHARSYNLANSVAVVLFEGLRRIHSKS